MNKGIPKWRRDAVRLAGKDLLHILCVVHDALVVYVDQLRWLLAG